MLSYNNELWFQKIVNRGEDDGVKNSGPPYSLPSYPALSISVLKQDIRIRYKRNSFFCPVNVLELSGLIKPAGFEDSRILPLSSVIKVEKCYTVSYLTLIQSNVVA